MLKELRVGYNFFMPLWAIVQSIATRCCGRHEALSPRATAHQVDHGTEREIDWTFGRKRHRVVLVPTMYPKGKEVPITSDIS